MKDLFIPYQIALDMKSIGFDELCFAMWTKGLSEFEYGSMMLPRIYSSGFRLDDTQSCKGYVNNHNNSFGIAAPLYSQCFEWFREKYKKVDYPEFDYDEQKWHCHSDYKRYVLFNTYEEAELACLIKLIEICNKEPDWDQLNDFPMDEL